MISSPQPAAIEARISTATWEPRRSMLVEVMTTSSYAAPRSERLANASYSPRIQPDGRVPRAGTSWLTGRRCALRNALSRRLT